MIFNKKLQKLAISKQTCIFLGMCEMVIVQDEPEIFQYKQRKRIGGMYTLDERSVLGHIKNKFFTKLHLH